MTLREALALPVEREVSRKDERRIEMAFKITHFPAARELADFDFKAQPRVDERQVLELATSRWIAHSDAGLLLGPPGVGKTGVSQLGATRNEPASESRPGSRRTSGDMVRNRGIRTSDAQSFSDRSVISTAIQRTLVGPTDILRFPTLR